MIIKQEPEDFIVDEIIDNSIISESGSYHIYKLTKRNYTTERAVTHLARALHIPRKHISYAGTKDKLAITSQYVSILGVSKEHVEKIELQDITLEFIGYAKEPVYLGKLIGNQFTIKVYGVNEVSALDSFFVPNYFGNQRFSAHNAEIGIHILKKHFKEAVDLIMQSDKDFSQMLKDYLETHESDYVGALRRLPQKTLLFFMHAVQSLIFNDSLSSFIEQSFESFGNEYSQGNLSFPTTLQSEVSQDFLSLVGFDSPSDMLPKYGLSTNNFIIKQLPELSLEGDKRLMWSKVTNCILTKENDCVVVSFTLEKGSYATIVLRQLFKENFANL